MTVNFILTKGQLIKPYKRAIKSAQRHQSPIILWYGGEKPDMKGVDAEARRVNVPTWLEDKPGCVIWDYLAYYLAYKRGGLFLGLDSHTIASAMDLLGDKEVVVSRDVPDDNHTCIHPFNNQFICLPDSAVMFEIRAAAKQRIRSGFLDHGSTGPALLTWFVDKYSDKMAGAPFPALCGFEGSFIWKFYLGVEPPPEGTRVLHLFASAYKELFYNGDIDTWIRQHPYLSDFATASNVDPAIYR
jgi:hypothetical protein